jgi:hypothetical protein
MIAGHLFEVRAMKFPCDVQRRADGQWTARHTGSSLGAVETTAATRDEALAKLRNELQYRIELCPCSGVSGDRAELVVHDPG